VRDGQWTPNDSIADRVLLLQKRCLCRSRTPCAMVSGPQTTQSRTGSCSYKRGVCVGAAPRARSVAHHEPPKRPGQPQAQHAAQMPCQMTPTAPGIAPGIVNHRPIYTLHRPTGQLQTQTNVGVLAIHKIPLIKPLHLRKGLSTEKHARPVDPVCLCNRSGHTRRRHTTPTPPHTAQQTPRRHQRTGKVLPQTICVQLQRTHQAHPITVGAAPRAR
jgi:hypothetical protein